MHAPTPNAGRPVRRAAFTLVEVLIVVVILAILAATVLPQFQNASGEAEASAIRQNLAVIRSQIELYRVQHTGQLPGDNEVTFLARMTAQTDRDGNAGTTYGPYIKGKFPENPAGDINKKDKIEFANTAPNDAALPAGGEGWWYNDTTGEFRAKGKLAYWTM